MLLQVLVERHGLKNHLFVQLRRIEQMQSILLPYGKAQVGYVEAGLLTGDGNDIAIVDDLAQQRLISHRLLGDEAILSTRHLLFHLADGANELRMLAKSLIALRMGAHLVNLYGLNSSEWRF